MFNVEQPWPVCESQRRDGGLPAAGQTLCSVKKKNMIINFKKKKKEKSFERRKPDFYLKLQSGEM